MSLTAFARCHRVGGDICVEMNKGLSGSGQEGHPGIRDGCHVVARVVVTLRHETAEIR